MALAGLAVVAAVLVARGGGGDPRAGEPAGPRAHRSSAPPPASTRSLNATLAAARDGGVIRLGARSYPASTITTRYPRRLTIDARGATVAGLDLRGAANITIRGGRFTGPVRIESTSGTTGSPADITIEGAEMTGGCLTILNRATSIALLDSHLHDCDTGIAGPGRPTAQLASSGIRVQGNTIERMRADGIQFGDWNHVVIAGNAIRDIADPRRVIHNDAIQLTGGSTDVTIDHNRLARSAAQLILVQAAIRPISDVRVTRNIAAPAGAVAIQSQGATRASYEHNLICGGDGGLWLRSGPGGAAPTDTVVRDNVMSSFQQMEGARAATHTGNRIGCPGR